MFWIHASTVERVEREIRHISWKQNLDGWDNSAVNQLELVSEWLGLDNTWLMVLDNADDEDVFFQSQRPVTTSPRTNDRLSTRPLSWYMLRRSLAGALLVTSRNKRTADRLTASEKGNIQVPCMGKDDAMSLLRQKLPGGSSSDDIKRDLCAVLDYCPLAITQAATFISVNEGHWTITNCVKHIIRDARSIISINMGDPRRDADVPNSLLLMWHITFDQIWKQNRRSIELISLMSFVNGQGIPEILLREDGGDNYQFHKTLAPLREFGLVTQVRNCHTFRVSQLVQDSVISWLQENGMLLKYKRLALNSLDRRTPHDEYEPCWMWDALLLHTESAFRHLFPEKEFRLKSASILHSCARYHLQRGTYRPGVEKCESSLTILSKTHGKAHISNVKGLILLADLKVKLGGHTEKTQRKAGPLIRGRSLFVSSYEM